MGKVSVESWPCKRKTSGDQTGLKLIFNKDSYFWVAPVPGLTLQPLVCTSGCRSYRAALASVITVDPPGYTTGA